MGPDRTRLTGRLASSIFLPQSMGFHGCSDTFFPKKRTFEEQMMSISCSVLQYWPSTAAKQF
ncbi:hypothetical protein predicted by Glimmer/Critica [Acetobacter senegalensis]|uniref:Uncharacterized protein n=1 Tax=Acetobacter senegalensis TaxID=446692 RepID=A0A0U5FJL2_9PROT|nr:hypothetical protein predicted by Glimmer/Critica [Acetobacter senegalensis]